MTESQWFDEWMRAWQSFPAAQSALSSNPWSAALDHFTKSQRAAYQQPFADALNKLVEQSRGFFDLGQQLVGNGGEDWRQSVLDYLDALGKQAMEPGAASQAFAGVSPLDYWRQLAGQDASSTGERPSFLAQLEKTLQTPALGYTREYQESVQELSRRWLEYESAYGEYAAYCAETNRRSLDKLRGQLEEAFAEDRGPDSVRGLYDAWVACSEEVYAERAVTPEYMSLHGRLVNTLMAYKQQAAWLMDQWAEGLGLPTRSEVDVLHRKLKDTRQELKALKARLDNESNAG